MELGSYLIIRTVFLKLTYLLLGRRLYPRRQPSPTFNCVKHLELLPTH